MFEIHIAQKFAKEHYATVEAKCKEAIENLKGKDIFTNIQEEFVGLSMDKIEYANEQFQKFLVWLEDDNYKHLEKIITAKPMALLGLYEQISRDFNFEIREESGIRRAFDTNCVKGKNVKENIEKIFNYKKFRDDLGYKFARKLNVRVCPYCNRQFTFTILSEEKTEVNNQRRKEVIRPEFDHYFSQKKYPIFAVSFYNLIPSCHICNSNIKGQNDMTVDQYYHPYIPEDKNFKFCYDKANIEKDNSESTITIKYNGIPKAQATCEFFYLDIIYRGHSDVSDKIWQIYHEYPPDRVNEILKKLKGREENISKQELLDIIFRGYKVENPDEEILGKLRSDLYEQMKENYK